MSVAGQDYILGFFVFKGKEYEFFCKYNEQLFKSLKNEILLYYSKEFVKDVRHIVFYEGEPKNG
jgi:hypothetical protein